MENFDKSKDLPGLKIEKEECLISRFLKEKIF
jgi:hypothetical protein